MLYLIGPPPPIPYCMIAVVVVEVGIGSTTFSLSTVEPDYLNTCYGPQWK